MKRKSKGQKLAVAVVIATTAMSFSGFTGRELVSEGSQTDTQEPITIIQEATFNDKTENDTGAHFVEPSEKQLKQSRRCLAGSETSGNDAESNNIPETEKLYWVEENDVTDDVPAVTPDPVVPTVVEPEPTETPVLPDVDPDSQSDAGADCTTAESPVNDDVAILATVVCFEAGGGCSDRHRDLTAMVVVNRVDSDQFPNTVYDVVTQPNQYLAGYADPDSYYRRTAMQNTELWETCCEIARRALNGEIDCPGNVLFQAEFVQGSGIYETHDTSYSTTYFCFA